MIKRKSFLTYNFVLIILFIIGAFLRIKLWFINHDMHCDEANLALNMIQENYLNLFKPLDRLQVAPPGFLVLSKLIYNAVKLHPTPWTSDFVLRFVPLLSGIAALPIFAYFLNSFTKNKIISILGVLFLAINPAAIAYSCIFKQYSTELLLSICMLILFTKIDFIKNTFKRNTIYFILLALTPLFTMMAYIILPGGFLYLLTKAIEQKSVKKFFQLSLIFSFVFFINVAFILIPVMNTHLADMEQYWEYTLKDINTFYSYIESFIEKTFRIFFKKYIQGFFILYIAGTVIMMLKNFKSVFLIPLLVYVTYLFSIYKGYPITERFFLFLLPFFFATILYPLSLIPESFVKRYETLLSIFILLITYSCCITIVPIRLINMKQECSRVVWEYYSKNCDQNLPLIEGLSTNSNQYYEILYNRNENNISWEDASSIPAGDYYIIFTRYDKHTKDFRDRMPNDPKIEILEQQVFERKLLEKTTHSAVIKFRKHSN